MERQSRWTKISVDYSLKGDSLKYELYREENRLKEGETHYFEKFENNTDVEVTEISEASISLLEKDAQGYRWIDSETIASNNLEDYDSVTLNTSAKPSSPNDGAKYILNYS